MAAKETSFSIAIGPGRRKDFECKQSGHITRHEVLRPGYGQRQKNTANRSKRRSNVQKYKYKPQPGKLDEHFHKHSCNHQLNFQFSSLSHKRTNFHSKKWLLLSLFSFSFLFSSFPTLIPSTKEMSFYASLVEKLFFQRFPRSASVF